MYCAWFALNILAHVLLHGGRYGLTCERLEILIIIARLEEASEEKHDRADVQVLVGRCFGAHQVGYESEQTHSFWREALACDAKEPLKSALHAGRIYCRRPWCSSHLRTGPSCGIRSGDPRPGRRAPAAGLELNKSTLYCEGSLLWLQEQDHTA